METLVFKAPMDRVNLLMTVVFGFVFLIGAPLIVLFVSPSGTFKVPFAILFAALIVLIHSYRILRFELTSNAIVIRRLFHSTSIAISDIQAVDIKPILVNAFTIRVFGMSGIYGSQGYFWNKKFGTFRAYVMNGNNVVGLTLKNGKRVFLSPERKEEFVEALSKLLLVTK